MFKHSININNIKSININTYFLSQLQLNEQIKQVIKLLLLFVLLTPYSVPI